MKLQTDLIMAYLHDTPMNLTQSYPLLPNVQEPDPMRKEVVQELVTRLEGIVELFPTFNPEVWNLLFQDSQHVLDEVIIVPVVGCQGHHMVKTDAVYLLLDLIHIADTTPIVSQMCYVMQNYLHQELAQLCIHQHYPFEGTNYQDMLDYFTFVHGLANFLAWNEAASQYQFQKEKYEPYKEKAFGMLNSAMEVESKALQHKILIHATKGEFWNQFPGVAGMFYLDDLYQELGIKAIQSWYQTGWKQLCHRIFEG